MFYSTAVGTFRLNCKSYKSAAIVEFYLGCGEQVQVSTDDGLNDIISNKRLFLDTTPH